MLIETSNVRQTPGDGTRRRWFSDGKMDLIVWYGGASEVTGFQFCYECAHESKAITWQEGRGYLHCGIDDGEGQAGVSKQTPILVSDGTFDKGVVLAAFRAASEGIEPALRSVVTDKLALCPSDGVAGPSCTTHRPS